MRNWNNADLVNLAMQFVLVQLQQLDLHLEVSVLSQQTVVTFHLRQYHIFSLAHKQEVRAPWGLMGRGI